MPWAWPRCWTRTVAIDLAFAPEWGHASLLDPPPGSVHGFVPSERADGRARYRKRARPKAAEVLPGVVCHPSCAPCPYAVPGNVSSASTLSRA